MQRVILVLVVVMVMISCSTQRALRRSYTGKPVSVLESRLGSPVTIMESAGDSIYIFEKTEKLRSTEISQGKLTLDPIITPQVRKTERFYFTVRNGVIVKTRFEEEYER